VVRMGLGCAAVLAGAGWAQAQPVALPPAPTGVEVTREYGIEFSTIRTAGIVPYIAPEAVPAWPVNDRGVPAGGDYRIARTEITTGQWMDFVNSFSTQSAELANFAWPIYWSAVPDLAYSGPGRRWRLNDSIPNAADASVYGMTWREAAMYCNWLHNGRGTSMSSITAGAYDTSTFGAGGPGLNEGFTDQLRRSPGARFWIPDLDEWVAGAFYDPSISRWRFSHYGSDVQPISGLPGDPGAMTNAWVQNPNVTIESLSELPVWAYGAQSPWGLLGTSGVEGEWLEDTNGTSTISGLPGARLLITSAPWADEGGDSILRAGRSADWPQLRGVVSFRIAASIPNPTTGACVLLFGLVAHSRRRLS